MSLARLQDSFTPVPPTKPTPTVIVMDCVRTNPALSIHHVLSLYISHADSRCHVFPISFSLLLSSLVLFFSNCNPAFSKSQLYFPSFTFSLARRGENRCYRGLLLFLSFSYLVSSMDSYLMGPFSLPSFSFLFLFFFFLPLHSRWKVFLFRILLRCFKFFM